MITRLLIISFWAVSLFSNSFAGDGFTIKRIDCDTYSDSLFMRIHGDGEPDFRSYELGNPARLIIAFENGRMPTDNVERSYSAPVKNIDIQYDFDNLSGIKVVCELEAKLAYDIRKGGDGIVVSLRLPDKTTAVKAMEPKAYPGWLDKKISVDIEGATLGEALSLMSRQNGFDIVSPALDDFRVSAHLTNVSIKEALDALINVSDYIYRVAGEVVIVKPIADKSPGELDTRIFKLKYLDARQIESQIKNMLSSRGLMQIMSTGAGPSSNEQAAYPTKMIAVTDLPPIFPLIEKYLSIIDIKPKQVSIDVKLIETNLSDNSDLGLDWQDNLMGKITGADPGFDAAGAQSERYSGYSGLPLKPGVFSYGTLTVSEVSLLIDYLETSGKSKLLSNPSVTTSDGKPARIEVATTIPIQTISRFSEGAVVQDIATFQFKDVGISLEVIPVVNDEGYIAMKCIPSVEEITGWSGPTDNQQPITSKRTVTTDVIVRDGETLVIGGLMKESVISDTKGLWLLSDIPVLGNLFRHHSEQKAKTDLMILIRPTIIQ